MSVVAPWAFMAFLLVATFTDLRALRIPNWLILVGLAIAGLRLAAAPALLGPHLLVGVVVFALSFGLFALNLIGGGDAKLFPVAGLWFGPSATPDFFLLMSLVAAPFALALFGLRVLLARVDARRERWPLILRRGAGVPLAVPSFAAAAMLQ